MNPWLLSIPLAYLLGSIPFGYLLVKIFRKQDIRATGSGNIGATNVARSGAKGLGLATLLLDLGKAFAAVKLAQYLAPANYDLAVAAAVAAILGHVFSACRLTAPSSIAPALIIAAPPNSQNMLGSTGPNAFWAATSAPSTRAARRT